MTPAPLAGIRVIDLGQYIPAPYASRLLADLGADVIKVEPPAGDPIVTFLPGLYEFLNRGKRTIRLNLKSDGAAELVLDLIASADVVLEGFRPGVADRLGVGFAAARAHRSDVIYCSISGYGQDGPRRDHPGHDLGFEAAGGAFAGVLGAGEEPTIPHIPIADLGSAQFAAISICAVLAGRGATDAQERQPVHLDVSMQETVTYAAAVRWGRFLSEGIAPELEDLAAYAPGIGLFRTADGHHVAVAAAEDKFWLGLCQSLELSELAQPPYDSHSGRMKGRSHLRAALGSAIATIPLQELEARLGQADVPFDLVQSAEQVCGDPHLLQRGAVAARATGAFLDFPVRIGDHRSWAEDRTPEARLDERSILDDLDVSKEREQLLRTSGALTVGE